MVKYFCDKCGKEIGKEEFVRIRYSVMYGVGTIHKRFDRGDKFRDFCRECAISFVGEEALTNCNERYSEAEKELGEMAKNIVRMKGEEK